MHRVARVLLATVVVVAISGASAGVAYAESAAVPTVKAEAWYDPTVHPLPHAVSAGLAAGDRSLGVLSAGGGCRDTYGAGSCISWHSPQLWADFYVNSWNHIASNGTGYLYTNVDGNWRYEYTVLTNFIGHYPIAQRTVSGSGVCESVVDFYDNSGGWLMSAYSPLLYVP